MSQFHYTGTGTLEVMEGAVRYNLFLENLLADFAGRAPALLDFGAGVGTFAKRMRARGLKVDCVEPDTAQSASLQASGFSVHAGLEQIPDAAYARIYSLNVLEHIEHDVEALKQLRRILQPGGKLLIYVPAFQLLYTSFDAEIGHFRRYTRAGLVVKLRAAGFTVESAEYVDSLGFFAWLLLKFLPRKSGGLNPNAVAFYDRVGFPLSRLCDTALKKLLGKNVMAVATV